MAVIIDGGGGDESPNLVGMEVLVGCGGRSNYRCVSVSLVVGREAW